MADLVELPFSAAPEPPAPTADDLQRTYENDPAAYSTPEIRRIKAVVLSPETVSRDVDVGDDEIRKPTTTPTRPTTSAPEKRSAQVLVTADEAAAGKLAAMWNGGADWAAMQQAATEQGASAVALDDADRTEYPATDLADAVFARATRHASLVRSSPRSAIR